MIKLNITDEVLDILGFTPYWDEHGDWGSRSLVFSNGSNLTICEYEESPDNSHGYDPSGGMYVAHRFIFNGWFTKEEHLKGVEKDVFFLHEMYDIVRNSRCLYTA